MFPIKSDREWERNMKTQLRGNGCWKTFGDQMGKWLGPAAGDQSWNSGDWSWEREQTRAVTLISADSQHHRPGEMGLLGVVVTVNGKLLNITTRQQINPIHFQFYSRPLFHVKIKISSNWRKLSLLYKISRVTSMYEFILLVRAPLPEGDLDRDK